MKPSPIRSEGMPYGMGLWKGVLSEGILWIGHDQF